MNCYMHVKLAGFSDESKSSHLLELDGKGPHLPRGSADAGCAVVKTRHHIVCVWFKLQTFPVILGQVALLFYKA